MQASRGGFQGRSLLKHSNQVSGGDNKAFNEMPEREGRTFQTFGETQVSTGTETKERGTGKPNSKDALQNTSSGSSVFDAEKRSLPRSLAHTRGCVCACAGHSTQPREKHMHGSQLQILCPLPLAFSPPILCDQSLFTFVG